MVERFDMDLLRPGDALLYRPSDFVGVCIALKTWTWLSHVEVYDGHCMSMAARSSGVNRYPTRTDHLAYVLRPRARIDFPRAERWFNDTARGQGYDLKGFLCFYLAAKHGERNRMFCSEFATRWYRKAGMDPFSQWIDADHVAPAQFLQSAMFHTVWAQRQRRSWA
jgi:hypothetical protein